MVVIIAEGPFTPRSGRRHSRSMPTPSKPQNTMVATNATSNTPTSGTSGRTVSCPLTPIACSAHSATKEPTMNTLKWEKLISSRMP